MANDLPKASIEPALLEHCAHIAEKVRGAGGRALLVGGCVRDAILQLPSKDIDIEVFGLEAKRLEVLLGERYALNHVGKSFGVYKLKGFPIDIALPRREMKEGLGHKAFAVHSDPQMGFAEAAARRDFTINAISWDPLTGELIDPWQGQSDLINGVLRHTSGQFAEDPLRVLRGMQFVARFRLEAAVETVKLCRTITTEGIAPERFFEEWRKLMTRGVAIGDGLRFLEQVGWLRFYPEIEAMVGCGQDPRWHPEGDAFAHTCLCLDAFAEERTGEEEEDLIVGLAVLCHDMGKPATSYCDEEGRIRSPGHDRAGVPVARAFLERITRHKDLIEAVLPLVREHMQPLALYRENPSDAAIRRLANRVGRIDRLVRVDSADRNGRGDYFKEPSPQGQWLLERAEELALKDSRPKPIVQGRHLIALGYKPGPDFKEALNACFEAQTEGCFTDEAGGVAFLESWLGQHRTEM